MWQLVGVMCCVAYCTLGLYITTYNVRTEMSALKVQVLAFLLISMEAVILFYQSKLARYRDTCERDSRHVPVTAPTISICFCIVRMRLTL